MALFKNPSKSGPLDVIRCDETGFLIWKWRPAGSSAGAASRENAIRWGSSLRVKSGEAAVFVYHKDGEIVQEFISGPYDSILKTENLPVITSAIGLAYNGNTPFQAEVYFINLAQILQIKIGVPYFDVADPRYPDRGVPVAVRGAMNFKISDIEDFIQKYQLRTISIDEFRETIKAATTKYVKNVVANAPDEYGIPVTQLEKKILEINEIIENHLKNRIQNEFGATITSIDISDIEVDKTSANYKFLLKKSDVDIKLNVASKIRGFVTDSANEAVGVATGAAAQVAELATDTATAAVDVNEYKYAKRKKSQIGFVKGFFKGDGDLSAADERPRFAANATKSATEFVNGIGSKFKKKSEEETPPPVPTNCYHVAFDGTSSGPFSMTELSELVKQGKLVPKTLVWKKGMETWAEAQTIEELQSLFTDESVPPLPPIPEN